MRGDNLSVFSNKERLENVVWYGLIPLGAARTLEMLEKALRDEVHHLRRVWSRFVWDLQGPSLLVTVAS
jgi:flagellar biosynthesis regulator FlaF